MIYADSATNCTFTMDNVLETGATTGVFTVKPFDPTRDASCIVRAVTRSGAFVERTYTFAGQPIIEATTSIDFGVISPSASVCREITIANPSTTTPLTLNALHLKGRSAGLTFPTGPIVIAPAEVRALQVCLLLDAGQTFTDTLIAEVDCGTITLTAVKGRANYSVGVHDDVLHATPRILSVVPNPARDVFTLHYAIEAAATIDLVDITGSVVAHMNVDALHSSVTLDAHTIAAGAYTAVLRCSAGVHTMHVIIAP
jgi:hypothetical protein